MVGSSPRVISTIQKWVILTARKYCFLGKNISYGKNITIFRPNLAHPNSVRKMVSSTLLLKHGVILVGLENY